MVYSGKQPKLRVSSFELAGNLPSKIPTLRNIDRIDVKHGGHSGPDSAVDAHPGDRTEPNAMEKRVERSIRCCECLRPLQAPHATLNLIEDTDSNLKIGLTTGWSSRRCATSGCEVLMARP